MLLLHNTQTIIPNFVTFVKVNLLAYMHVSLENQRVRVPYEYGFYVGTIGGGDT